MHIQHLFRLFEPLYFSSPIFFLSRPSAFREWNHKSIKASLEQQPPVVFLYHSRLEKRGGYKKHASPVRTSENRKMLRNRGRDNHQAFPGCETPLFDIPWLFSQFSAEHIGKGTTASHPLLINAPARGGVLLPLGGAFYYWRPLHAAWRVAAACVQLRSPAWNGKRYKRSAVTPQNHSSSDRTVSRYKEKYITSTRRPKIHITKSTGLLSCRQLHRSPTHWWFTVNSYAAYSIGRTGG